MNEPQFIPIIESQMQVQNKYIRFARSQCTFCTSENAEYKLYRTRSSRRNACRYFNGSFYSASYKLSQHFKVLHNLALISVLDRSSVRQKSVIIALHRIMFDCLFAMFLPIFVSGRF